ncbi:MAG: hypothetical protein ACYDAE_19565 [Steroidobacteraceae bacterium]
MRTPNQTSFKPVHGMSRGSKDATPPTYLSWQRMKSRCLNPNDKDYRHYGGRGIRVCERWLKFENFLADMGERPAGTQLDRRENNGHYEPGNCRWITKKQNSRNRRRSVMVTVDGVTRCAAEWAELKGLPLETVSARLKRGWSAERAVNTPLDARYSR